MDVQKKPDKSVYVAAPIVGITETQEKQIKAVIHQCIVQFGGKNVYCPASLRIPNAWNMPLNEWARCVFTNDVMEIDRSEIVVVCDYGRNATAGTAWEAGYAFAKGSKVLVVQMPGVDEVSLMVRNGCAAVVDYNDFVNGRFSWPDYRNQSGVRQN